MNIDFDELPTLVIAETYGCEGSRRRVTYLLLNETHGLCLDKKDLMTGQLEACGKLLRYTGDQGDRAALEQEMQELKMALDLMT